MEKSFFGAEKRKKYIKEKLQKSEAPISASVFAKRLGVSRQIIVGDIALLRAAGEKILSTPRGYLLERENASSQEIYLAACTHAPEQTELELKTIVYYGGEVMDVIVSHPLYGQISAPLNIRTNYEVEQFIEALKSKEAALLSDLTGGVHLHHIRCADKSIFARICDALDRLGMIYHAEE